MKVFKFGGASVKDADSVRNAIHIVEQHLDKGAVVISAMGKTTNALEGIWKDYIVGASTAKAYKELVAFHKAIAVALDERGVVLGAFESVALALKQKLEQAPQAQADVEYDALVSFGEMWSTQLVAAYAKVQGLRAEWFDVRNLIVTDHDHRKAKVLWPQCEERSKTLKKLLETDTDIIITQGFVGRSTLGNTTTLGREGSDYSGAILAYLLDAESLTIWKDVPGMLNADPRWFKETKKLEQISYREAIELSYYGASVIHPKTIQPIQSKGIPLYVKSFKKPLLVGSKIHTATGYDKLIPSYIFKPNQTLLSLIPRDFSFVEEDQLAALFKQFSDLKIHIQLIQNSALSLTVCIDDEPEKREQLIEQLKAQFAIKFNTGLELWTVRHPTDSVESQIKLGKEVMLQQRSRHTLRMLLKPQK